MKLIGLSGANGSGKDTVAHLLVREYGFYFGSATDMLRDEHERLGRPVDRVQKSALSAEWRREYGMGVIVQRAYDHYKAHEAEYGGVIVGSLRHPGEADLVHELGGKMLWIDADPRVRYDRIQAANRGRAEDNKTFEAFLADEEREKYPEGDSATLHVAAVKERADIFIMNDGNDLAEFEKHVIFTLTEAGLL